MPSPARTSAALTVALVAGAVLAGCAAPGSSGGPTPGSTVQNGPATSPAYPDEGRPPSASIQVPTVVGDDIEVTWESSDPDGDLLTHTLAYSPDGGETWQGFAVGLEKTSMTAPRWGLPGSDDGLLKVIVSDGTHTIEAVSERFSLPNNAPMVYIEEESFEVSVAAPVILDADALDPEDGQLPGESIVWTSDIDGLLGTGNQLYCMNDRLSVGEHTILATATDSAGDTQSARVVVTVLDDAGPHGLLDRSPAPAGGRCTR